jgi:hypothetical protein
MIKENFHKLNVPHLTSCLERAAVMPSLGVDMGSSGKKLFDSIDTVRTSPTGSSWALRHYHGHAVSSV